MQLVTPAFHVTQDDEFLHVHLSCAERKTEEVRIVAEHCTFGCFVDPTYLPYVLPPDDVTAIHDTVFLYHVLYSRFMR